MKAALALLAAAPLVLAEPARHETPDPDAESRTPPAGQPEATMRVIGEPESAVCRDRIHRVREERGLPTLDRGTASPDEPYFIAAVDQRIDGCSVMVMRNNTADIRPLPELPDAPTSLTPAR